MWVRRWQDVLRPGKGSDALVSPDPTEDSANVPPPIPRLTLSQSKVGTALTGPVWVRVGTESKVTRARGLLGGPERLRPGAGDGSAQPQVEPTCSKKKPFPLRQLDFVVKFPSS